MARVVRASGRTEPGAWRPLISKPQMSRSQYHSSAYVQAYFDMDEESTHLLPQEGAAGGGAAAGCGAETHCVR